jgi:hypothetical protein
VAHRSIDAAINLMQDKIKDGVKENAPAFSGAFDKPI